MRIKDPNTIAGILETGYYDLRTHYVWRYIHDDNKGELNYHITIQSLESFIAVSEMVKVRKYSVSAFLDEWNNSDHPALQECSYDEPSGHLHLKSRTYTFDYYDQTNEYHFVTYPEVADLIRLNKRETRKQYVRGGLFPLSYLVELDEQLYSRYEDALKLEAWKQSPQLQIDIDYCRSMIPYIEQLAPQAERYLMHSQYLDIILEGNDRVRIGFVMYHSPEEMMALPSYLREDWKQGIDAAVEKVREVFEEEVSKKKAEFEEFSKELTKAILGQTPCKDPYVRYQWKLGHYSYEELLLCEALDKDIDDRKWMHEKMLFEPIFSLISFTSREKKVSCYETDTFVYKMNKQGKRATIQMKDLHLAKTLNIDLESEFELVKYSKIIEKTLTKYNDYLKEVYRNCLHREERRKQPHHSLLVEAVKHIIQFTAPLIAYSGTNPRLLNKYNLVFSVSDSDTLLVTLEHKRVKVSEQFTLDDFSSRFRVWWSQMLIKESKQAKEASLHPEDFFDMSEIYF